jgi:hypothetical protein
MTSTRIVGGCNLMMKYQSGDGMIEDIPIQQKREAALQV